MQRLYCCLPEFRSAAFLVFFNFRLLENNLFFNSTGKYDIFIRSAKNLRDKGKVLSLDEWRKLGYETNSLIGDPCFVDPENDDYRLKPDSPALKLGFQQIYVNMIGPRGK